jgi:PncC family amidohydrolase
MDTQRHSRRIGKLLTKKKLSLAVAESCTGGMVGSAITDIAGSSRYFAGGVIAYDNSIKRRVLKVPQTTLDNYGAVSSQTVRAMARGAQRLFKADCAIAVSGIAGPGGGTEEKPVGLVYIGIAVRKKGFDFECRFKGTRREIRLKTVEQALKKIVEIV